MHSLFEKYKSSVIHYYKSGNSNNPILLCFHGYGESAASFCFLEKYIGNDFTIIAIDLPFHGETSWREGLDFTPPDLLEIIQEITRDCSHHTSKMYIAGFSMGARIALGLLPYMPDRIKKMVCLSPDGLRTNGWYWLATQNKTGNAFFRATMKKPGLFLGILLIAKKLHLINPGIYTFMGHYLNTKEARNNLYNRWTAMRKFRPARQKIKSIICDNHIPVILLYGAHDRITRFERGKEFTRGIEDHCELRVIPSGHQLLHEKNIELIVGLLKD